MQRFTHTSLGKGTLGNPTAQQISFGWILSDLFSEECFPPSRHIAGLQCTVNHDFLDILRRFVVQEALPTVYPKFTLSVEECEKLFLSIYRRSKDNRHIVRLSIKHRLMTEILKNGF